MSENLCLSAERAVTVNKTGAQSVQATGFELLQTPTHITMLILASADRKAAYITWAKSCGRDVREDIFAPDDFWCEYPIGSRIVNTTNDHIAELEDFLLRMDEGGYDVEWYAK